MKSEQETQSAASPRWRSAWEKLATALAVISLVDLSGQLIKWAALIHWIVERYAIVRNWLFGWLPFHVPPEWRNYIVLFLAVFSVTNLGFYQRTGRTYAKQLFLFFRDYPHGGLEGIPVEWSKEKPGTLEDRVAIVATVAILLAGWVLAMVVLLFWSHPNGCGTN
jgi:hypothetical protein